MHRWFVFTALLNAAAHPVWPNRGFISTTGGYNGPILVAESRGTRTVLWNIYKEHGYRYNREVGKQAK